MSTCGCALCMWVSEFGRDIPVFLPDDCHKNCVFIVGAAPKPQNEKCILNCLFERREQKGAGEGAMLKGRGATCVWLNQLNARVCAFLSCFPRFNGVGENCHAANGKLVPRASFSISQLKFIAHTLTYNATPLCLTCHTQLPTCLAYMLFLHNNLQSILRFASPAICISRKVSLPKHSGAVWQCGTVVWCGGVGNVCIM